MAVVILQKLVGEIFFVFFQGNLAGYLTGMLREFLGSDISTQRNTHIKNEGAPQCSPKFFMWVAPSASFQEKGPPRKEF